MIKRQQREKTKRNLCWEFCVYEWSTPNNGQRQHRIPRTILSHSTLYLYFHIYCTFAAVTRQQQIDNHDSWLTSTPIDSSTLETQDIDHRNAYNRTNHSRYPATSSSTHHYHTHPTSHQPPPPPTLHRHRVASSRTSTAAAIPSSALHPQSSSFTASVSLDPPEDDHHLLHQQPAGRSHSTYSAALHSLHQQQSTSSTSSGYHPSSVSSSRSTGAARAAFSSSSADVEMFGESHKITERRKKTVRFDGQDPADDWSRWATERQGSQDSATKDSGIDTCSTFTSSEDSNRGDGPKVYDATPSLTAF